MDKFTLIVAAMMIPFGIYFYFLLKRAATFWNVDTGKKVVRVILMVCAVGICALVLSVWSIQAVVVSHILMVAIVTEVINLVLNASWWDKAYKSGLIPLVVTAGIMAFGYWNIGYVVQTEYNINTDKAIQGTGYKIAFIADVHFGENMGEEELKNICEKIQKEKPDMVILGGDILEEHTTQQDMKKALMILGDLESPYGTFYVYGNHDRQPYAEKPVYTEEQLATCLESQGIKILEDRVYKVNEEILIAGRGDFDRGRESLGDLLAKVDKSKFMLMVDHQPKELEENSKAGVDMILSGHTHAGQVWPIGNVAELLGINEFNYGQKEIGSLHTIVTSGLHGWGYPIRTQEHSEYVMIQIKGDEK